MEKNEFRAYIKIGAKLGVSAQTITDKLVLANGNQAPKYNNGRESLEDDPH